MAAWAAARVSHTTARAVGTPAVCMTVFANAFELSMRAAAAEAPKQAMPASAIRSARPAASGASGPTTTRSTASRDARSVIASSSETRHVVERRNAADPGVPGRGVELGEAR